MKKLILILLFLMVAGFSKAQNSSIVYDSISVTNPVITINMTYRAGPGEISYKYCGIELKTDTVALFDSIQVASSWGTGDTANTGVRSTLTFNDASLITFPITSTWYKFYILDPTPRYYFIIFKNATKGTRQIYLKYMLIK